MKRLFVITMVVSFIACNHLPKKNNEVTESNKQADVFPVSSFVSEQIHEVDSLDFQIVKYTSINNQTDSARITNEEFKRLANEFLHPDITHPSIKKYYNETSFADQSIPSVTLTYSTLNRALEIQRVDVIIQPDPLISDKVKTIYLEKFMNKNDTSIMKKMLWNANKDFQIITSIEIRNQPQAIIILKVVWGEGIQ